MSKKIRKPQKPKVRNWVARAVLDPDGPYRAKTIKDRTKFSRKKKHPKQVDFDLD